MSAEVKNRVFLTKDDSVVKCENNLVTLTFADGETYNRLEPRRLFPVNKIYNYITLLNEDGKEIAVIRDIADLNDSSRAVINTSLDEYYLVPLITKIVSITEKSGTLNWQVETNRGFKAFDVRDRNHDIRIYNDGSVRVRDSHDNRYVIEDYRKLDKHSYKQLSADL